VFLPEQAGIQNCRPFFIFHERFSKQLDPVSNAHQGGESRMKGFKRYLVFLGLMGGAKAFNRW